MDPRRLQPPPASKHVTQKETSQLTYRRYQKRFSTHATSSSPIAQHDTQKETTQLTCKRYKKRFSTHAASSSPIPQHEIQEAVQEVKTEEVEHEEAVPQANIETEIEEHRDEETEQQVQTDGHETGAQVEVEEMVEEFLQQVEDEEMVEERVARPDKGKWPSVETSNSRHKKRKLAKRGTLTIQEPEEMPPELSDSMSEQGRMQAPIEEEEIREEEPKRIRKNVQQLIQSPGRLNGYNPRRFISQRAYEEYKQMGTRDIILDRGFCEHDMDNPYIRDAIKSRGWERFVKHRSGWYSWELTRIFTANLNYDDNGFKSWVDGVEVPYGPKVINELYGMVPVPKGNDPYAFIQSEPNKNENCKLVLEAMFEKQESVAYYSYSNSNNKRVDGQKMDAPHYQWLMLYKSKIAPRDHTSGPNTADLFIPFCLKTGRPVDIGHIIANELHNRHGNHRSKLCFPCLIWQLCKKAGVDLSKYQLDLKMKPPIPFKTFVLPGVPSATLRLPPDHNAPARSLCSDAPTPSRAAQGSRRSQRGGLAQEASRAPNLALEVHRLREEIAERDRTYEEQRRLDREKIDQMIRRQAQMDAKIEFLIGRLVGPEDAQPTPAAADEDADGRDDGSDDDDSNSNC